MPIPGDLLKTLQNALLEAFDSASLRQFVRHSLDQQLPEIAPQGNFVEQVESLLAWAERQGRLVELIAGAAAEVPGNSALQAAHARFRTFLSETENPSPHPPERAGLGNTHPGCRLYGVPSTRSVEFVGRSAELAQLTEILTGEHRSVRIAATVEGLAGIGKTELALQVVHHLAETAAFPGGIFWFDAENADLTAAWGSVIADQMDMPGGTVTDRATAALRTLSTRDKPTLIVLDNVERWTKSHQPEPLPTGNHLRYLVTTRRRRLGGSRFRHVSLGFLAPGYARELMIAVADRDLAADAGFEELLEHLGGHALAVELAGAYLSEYPEETPAGYLKSLRTGGEIDAELGELVRYNRTIFQAFEAIWSQLDERARSAWRLAACFEPEFAEPELADAVGLSRQDRRNLRRLHLIEADTGGRWRMHRLTRDFGRQAGAENELTGAREAFVEGCLSFSRNIDVAAGFRIYLPNRVHLDAALDQSTEVLEPGDSRVSYFQDRIGTALQSAGDLKAARRLLERALESDLANLGEEHPYVATRRSNLAMVLQDLGELEQARKLLEMALDSAIENLGEEHPDVASSRSNLATVLQDLGELEQARKLLEIALDSAIENLGEEHPDVATSRSNLALVLQDLGELEQARKLLEIALDSAIENLGEEHPYVATSRSYLALVLKDLGDLEQARKLLEMALDSAIENLGEEHPYVATHRFNLASICEAEGDLKAAQELLEQTLKAEMSSLGVNHPSLGLTRAKLADVLHEQGKAEPAQQEAREALEIVAAQPEGSVFRTRVEQIARKIL